MHGKRNRHRPWLRFVTLSRYRRGLVNRSFGPRCVKEGETEDAEVLRRGVLLLFAATLTVAAGPGPAIPVSTAPVKRQDLPINLSGLGTVQAFRTVQVRAQVTGVLIALPAKEGQEVKTGDVIAEIDPRPYKAALDQATAQRDKDVAQLRGAELDLKRYQDLAKRNFAPVQQVDDQQATVSTDAAAIAVDNAQIETARLNLDYCTIKAPFDGRVGFYQQNIGTLIQASGTTTILSITQDRPIEVVFTLPEDELQQVQAANTPPVTVFDSSGQHELATGTLMTPDNMIDTATGTISLKAVFDNKDRRLWPGEFVNARIQVGTVTNAVTVPDAAIVTGPDGPYVFTVKPDGTVDQANVKLGHRQPGYVEIASGLVGNETVVVSGQSRLEPGVHVTTNKSPPA